MANELKIILDPVQQTGLTVDAKVRSQDCTQQGSTVTMTEPQTGCYVGTYDFSVLVDGEYTVDFTDNTTGRLLGNGTVQIKDGAELKGYQFSTSAEISALNNLSEAEVAALLAAYDAPTLAEMTAAFTEIKGAGWTVTDTLEAIRDAITAGVVTPATIWEYTTRELTAGTKDTEIDAIKERTDNLPDSPASKLDTIIAANI